MITNDDLRRIKIFEDLSEEHLSWLAARFEEVVLEPNEPFTEAGAKAEWMFVLIEGRIQFVSSDPRLGRGVFNVQAGSVTGMLPNSRMTHFTAGSFAAEPSRVGKLHIDHFPDMLVAIPVLEQRLAHVMLDRTRSTASLRVQQEKLAALGTMAAGLAHELNNPASAAKRDAQKLCDTLQAFDMHASSMLSKVMFKELNGDADPFQPIYEVILGDPPVLDTLTQSEMEDDLSDWLEEHNIEEPWDVAATLVTAGLTRDILTDFVPLLVPEHVGNFLNWLARDVEMRALSNALAISTERISSLVTAMKSYSYMDQATDKSLTDVHKGIEDTLIVMGHKFRSKKVTVQKNFGDVPKFNAYGNELNQVWTNLLDNAVDAVPEKNGVIAIDTRYDAGEKCVHVDVTDNGHGIPEEKQSRIFEPFFTTKEAGKGTGLGLDITYRIVTGRHGGTLLVESEPGSTRFKVRLPI